MVKGIQGMTLTKHMERTVSPYFRRKKWGFQEESLQEKNVSDRVWCV